MRNPERAIDPETEEMRSGGKKNYKDTPEYGDFKLEQEKDRRIEEEIDAECPECRYWAGVGKRGKIRVEAEK